MHSQSPSAASPLDLGSAEQAFSRGGNRLCFVHPQHPDRCIKVLRPDRTPAIKRREKSFPKRLKPLSRFDDNLQEMRVYRRIERHIGPAALELIPRCYGLEDSNWGSGLVSGLVRDDDGRIAITLKQYLWTRGRSAPLERCLQDFAERWTSLGMPSRNLLLHNLVLQCEAGQPRRLWVIDGLGWADIVPLAYWLPAVARRKAQRKITYLEQAIDALLDKQERNADYGYHGWMDDSKR